MRATAISFRPHTSGYLGKKAGVDIYGPKTWAMHVVTDLPSKEAILLCEHEDDMKDNIEDFLWIQKPVDRWSGVALVFNITTEVATQAFGGKPERAIALVKQLLQKVELCL